GKTLLHSNENLIGRQMMDDFIKAVSEKGEPVYSYITLGTGEKVFVLNYPVHIKGTERIGRIALHTYPSERIVRQAMLQIISIVVIIIILWIIGYFFIRAVNKTEHIKAMLAEKERLAAIGEMASVLAHEIRNPLGSIKGFAQYLKDRTWHRRQMSLT
ncbi:MAG: histidine kinase dimerization/phospho-acceptor domain-containing protein, partial [Thermodesulfovibrionales bacterium]|nr:histidine kinase dimerization/phospho-acceptor domain-containing protein [Thermodesulfovibrionales bacterium]